MGAIIAGVAIFYFIGALFLSGLVALLSFSIHSKLNRNRKDAGKVSIFVTIILIFIGAILIGTIETPMGMGGSNYEQWLDAWKTKAILYGLLPGVSLLLSVFACVFCPLKET